MMTFYGLLFLIPSVIFNTIFVASDEGTISGKVGYWFGLTGGIFGLFSMCVNYIAQEDPVGLSLYIMILIPIFSICIIVLAGLLFARANQLSASTIK